MGTFWPQLSFNINVQSEKISYCSARWGWRSNLGYVTLFKCSQWNPFHISLKLSGSFYLTDLCWKQLKFVSLKVQIRNIFKNIISTACKWSKIGQYYVNSMVISCSKRKKENGHALDIVLLQFQICRDLCAKSVFPMFIGSDSVLSRCLVND